MARGAEARSASGRPAVWICGDCHAGNLGPVAAMDGRKVSLIGSHEVAYLEHCRRYATQVST